MTLREAISRLDELPDGATLFIERINGSIVPECRAVAVELDEDEQRRPVAEVAKSCAPGTEYFLEVSVAREVEEGWKRNHAGQKPSLTLLLESVIYYAENDAYPDSFFS